jgi:hypothetical protein
VVAVTGSYPEGMFRFVEGVLRWNTRVTAFVFSLTDRYPPFSLKADPDYPIDVVIERPAQSSRLYAVFTLIVEALAIAAVIGAAIWLELSLTGQSWGAYDVQSPWNANGDVWWSSPGVLLLRVLAALPHEIIVFALGIAAFVVWLMVQWVILFAARYPRGLHDFVAGVTRWRTRVSAYTLGLVDRYPPFTFDPSLTESGATPPSAAGRPELPVGSTGELALS